VILGKKRYFMIGQQRWSVEVTDKDSWVGTEAGECLPNECRIKIREGHPDVMRDTFLHEIIHAILSIQGVGDLLHDKQEEDVVRALTPVLDQVLVWKVRGLK
jgi:hypothetical protein